MINVTLYVRQDCPECDQVKADLDALQDEYPHKLVILDVDSDETLQEKFESVPVVVIGPYQREAPITRQDLQVSLGAAQHRDDQLTAVDDSKHKFQKERGSQISRADRFSFWLSKNYIWVLNTLVFLYVGLSFLAPMLMSIGWVTPAKVIYKGYSVVCHNLAYRSWFLFGEQPVYPREAANVPGYATYGEITGNGEGNTYQEIIDARTYVGDAQYGYKVAFCERDVAIYAAILVFGLLFAFTGRKMKAIPWWIWISVGMGPIALDGFSQLLSQMDSIPILGDLIFWDYRESTPFLRTLTGGIFGFMTAWFGYPMFEETMRDTRRALLVKFKRLGVEIEE